MTVTLSLRFVIYMQYCIPCTLGEACVQASVLRYTYMEESPITLNVYRLWKASIQPNKYGQCIKKKKRNWLGKLSCSLTGYQKITKLFTVFITFFLHNPVCTAGDDGRVRFRLEPWENLIMWLTVTTREV